MTNEERKAAVEAFQTAARITGESAWALGAQIHDFEVDERLVSHYSETLQEDRSTLKDKYRRHWRYGWQNALSERARRLLPAGG